MASPKHRSRITPPATVADVSDLRTPAHQPGPGGKNPDGSRYGWDPVATPWRVLQNYDAAWPQYGRSDTFTFATQAEAEAALMRGFPKGCSSMSLDWAENAQEWKDGGRGRWARFGYWKNPRLVKAAAKRGA